MSEERTMTLPTWLLPTLLGGLVTGPLGWIGHDLVAEQQPAVLAQGVDRLRVDLDHLSRKVDEVHAQLYQAGSDRWTRSDHRDFESSKLEPRLRDLDARLRALETSRK